MEQRLLSICAAEASYLIPCSQTSWGLPMHGGLLTGVSSCSTGFEEGTANFLEDCRWCHFHFLLLSLLPWGFFMPGKILPCYCVSLFFFLLIANGSTYLPCVVTYILPVVFRLGVHVHPGPGFRSQRTTRSFSGKLGGSVWPRWINRLVMR